MPAESNKPSKEWRERIPEGEERRLEELARSLSEVRRGERTDRTLHAKGFGAEGVFTVLPDLPEHARAGLFAEPRAYRAYVRFSNGSNKRQADGKGDIRGIAIKVVGVEGKKIISGMENAKTQDFLAIHTPTFSFPTPDAFVSTLRAVSGSPLLALPRVVSALGARALKVLPRLQSVLAFSPKSVATVPFFSAAAIRFGEYAGQFALAPVANEEPGQTFPTLREELAERLRRGVIEWDFYVRFFTDETKTPIEDPTVEWSEAPEVVVARLTLVRQDLDSPRGKQLDALVEGWSFDPWHALQEHRPLGAIMRARNHAYRVSTQARGAAPEPDGSEQLE